MIKYIFILVTIFFVSINIHANTQLVDINKWLEKYRSQINLFEDENNKNPSFGAYSLINQYKKILKYYNSIRNNIKKTKLTNGQIIDYIPFALTPGVINESKSFIETCKGITYNTLIPIVRLNPILVSKYNINPIKSAPLNEEPEHKYEKDLPDYYHIFLTNNGTYEFTNSSKVNEVEMKVKAGNTSYPATVESSAHYLEQLWWLAPSRDNPICSFEAGLMKSCYFSITNNSIESIFIAATNNSYQNYYYNLTPGTSFVQTNPDFILGTPVNKDTIYTLKYKYDNKSERVFFYIKENEGPYSEIGFYKAGFSSVFQKMGESTLSSGFELCVCEPGTYISQGTIYYCASNSKKHLPENYYIQSSISNTYFNVTLANNTISNDSTTLYNPYQRVGLINFINNSFENITVFLSYNNITTFNSIDQAIAKITIPSLSTFTPVYIWTKSYLPKNNTSRSIKLSITSENFTYNNDCMIDVKCNWTGKSSFSSLKNYTLIFDKPSQNMTYNFNKNLNELNLNFIIPERSYATPYNIVFENNTQIDFPITIKGEDIFLSEPNNNIPLTSFQLPFRSNKKFSLNCVKNSDNLVLSLNSSTFKYGSINTITGTIDMTKNKENNFREKIELSSNNKHITFSTALNDKTFTVVINENKSYFQKLQKKTIANIQFKNNTDKGIALNYSPTGMYLHQIFGAETTNIIIAPNSTSQNYILESYSTNGSIEFISSNQLKGTVPLNYQILTGTLSYSTGSNNKKEISCILSGKVGISYSFSEKDEKNKTYIIEINNS